MSHQAIAAPKTTIFFQDDGQDFLEWDIENGEVVESRPFQTEVWKGIKVNLSNVLVGVNLPVTLKDGKKTFIIHPVERISIRRRQRRR